MKESNRPLRTPAQWEPQSCIWLAWPHNLQTWPGRFDPLPNFFVSWVNTITDSTPVRVVASVDVARQCESMLTGIANVDCVDIPTNDCWIRDYGPTFVVRRAEPIRREPDPFGKLQSADRVHKIEAVNWRYNAWGGKYPPWDLDDHVASAICKDQSIDCVDSRLCLEGGAIEVDGDQRLLTTRSCLLTPTRNPGWTQPQIEVELKRQLGVTEILWLSGGRLQGDDTDGHIDQLARFIDSQNVVAAVCDDKSDPNHRPLAENYKQLCDWAKVTSPEVTIHRLPIPPARYIDEQRVPESYCNFLRLGADRILVPTFNAATDDFAIGLLNELTESTNEPIDCQDLVWGLGALHCASRDQPA